MDYVKPADVVKTMIDAGAAKGALTAKNLLIRGFLSGALLGFATSFAFTATGQTGVPLVGALVFPVGFVMIVVLGLELGTGSFALLPLAWMEKRLGFGTLLGNLGWVLLGNLLGGVVYGALLYGTLTSMGHVAAAGIGPALVKAAEAKTVGYAALGAAGWWTAFVKAILCNWMVCLGVVMGMTSTSTAGKIVAAWLPITIFFAHGYEHSIVNMFVIPTGMMLGAKVTVAQWLAWNLVPVTLGNAVGGFVFTGLALYLTHHAPIRPYVGVEIADPAADDVLSLPSLR